MTVTDDTLPDQPTDDVDHGDLVEQDDTAPYDPLAALTVNELAVGSRHLKASLYAAISNQSADYERGLAVVLWLHRRRADPAAALGECMRLSFRDLDTALGQLQPDPTTPASSPS